MRIIYFISALAFLLTSMTANAEVLLSPATGVAVLATNGKALSSGNFFSGNDQIELNNGLNQVVIQYTAEIKESADDYTLETSKVFVLTFKASDTTVSINAPKINKQQQLDDFNSKKNWSLKSSEGKAISYQVDILEKPGFQLVRDYERELENFNQSNSPAALAGNAITTVDTTLQPKNSTSGINKSNTESTKKNMAADMLRFWYEQADPDTRADFLRWITTK